MDRRRPTAPRRSVLAAVGGALLAGCSTNIGSTGPLAQSTETADGAAGEGGTVHAYVGSYHWGFFLLDADGRERDRLRLSAGDELRLTAFSVEAETAVERLPSAVRDGIPSSQERARRNQQRVPVPQGIDLDELHEAAEATYPDHGLGIVLDQLLVRRPVGPGQQGPGQPGQPGQGPMWGGGQPGGTPGWGHHGPGGQGGPHMPGPHGPGWGGGYGGTLAPSLYLWHHSTVPAELGFVVETPGSYGFVCPVYCGYGHPYMAERGRVVVDAE